MLWFFSNEFSSKNDEIHDNSAVSLNYSDADKNRFLSVSGEAFIVHDKAKAAELWTFANKAWFPKGLNDPALSLIKVNVTKAEYWDGVGDHKKVTL